MAKRVYFAFHYKDVADFRANVVRNHSVAEGTTKAGYYDASIWEESKKKGVASLKSMIDAELENTTVTAVLVGSETYARRWVKYEIFKSIHRANNLVGIHINNISDKFKKTCALGPNPFDYLALSFDADGKSVTPMEYISGKWEVYGDMGSYTLRQQNLANAGKGYKLSHWYQTHDWVADKGYDNFQSWIA